LLYGCSAGHAYIVRLQRTLSLLVCVQALLESPDAQAADTAGLQLAVALGFAVYGFKEWKKLSLGESRWI
jgi:hypothetical protein